MTEKAETALTAGPRAHGAEPRPALERALLLRATLWRFADGFGLELSSFLFFLVLGRLLAPEAFGLVAIAGAFIQACQVLLRGGFGAAILQRPELEPEHLSAALWANIGMGGVCAVLLLTLAWPLAVFQDKAQLLPVLAALTPVLLLSSVSWIFQAYLKRLLRYDLAASSSLLSVLAGGLVGVAMAIGGAGVWSLVGQQLAGALTAFAVLLITVPWRPGLEMSWHHLRKLRSFATNAVLGDVLDFAGRRLDIVILGFFLGTHAIGLYFVATRLVFTVSMLTYFVVYDLCLAVLSHLHAEPDTLREAAARTLQLTSLLCLPAFLGLALVAEPLIALLFGAVWIEAAMPLQVMAVANIPFALTLTIRQILKAAGRADLALGLAVANAALSFVAVLLAAPWGLAAVAAAGGVAAGACLPLAFLLLRRTIGVPVRRILRDQLPIAGASVVMVASVVLLGQVERWSDLPASPLATLVLAVALGCSAFGSALWLLAPSLCRTLQGLTSVLRRRQVQA